MKHIVASLVVTALGVAIVPMAGAAAFPEEGRPIKIVVPYTAGGSSDYVARLVASKIAENSKHDIVVENKPGGSTILGGNYVARSAPNGYTVYLISEVTNGSLPALNKNLPYDPATAFAGISNMVESPLVIAVRPSFPAKDLKEFTEYIRANPGVVTYGSAGAGNTLHLAGAKFAADNGLEMTHVPYKGASQALIDLVAGRIDVMFDLPQTPLPHIQDGKLRALAVTGKERLSFLPDVPTTAEAGMPNYTFSTRIGLAVPADTPQEAKQWLHQQTLKAMNDPDVKKAFAERALFNATHDKPEDYDKDLRAAVDSIGQLLRNAGVQPQ